MTAIGVEFKGSQLASLLKEIGADAPWIKDAISIVGETLDVAIGLVFSAHEFITAVTPELVPDLDCLRDVMVIPKGLTLILSMRLAYGPCACADGTTDCSSYQFCAFIRKYFGDPGISLWIGGSGAGISLGAALSNVILVRDDCLGDVGGLYERGRPMFALQTLQVGAAAHSPDVQVVANTLRPYAIVTGHATTRSDVAPVAVCRPSCRLPMGVTTPLSLYWQRGRDCLHVPGATSQPLTCHIDANGTPSWWLQVSVTLSTSMIELAIECFLLLDIGNILLDGDTNRCAYFPADGEAYDYIEPLMFRISISITPTSLMLSGAMIGTWHGAFGVDM